MLVIPIDDWQRLLRAPSLATPLGTCTVQVVPGPLQAAQQAAGRPQLPQCQFAVAQAAALHSLQHPLH